MLELMKELLNYPVVSEDILNFYLSKAQTAIKAYSNIDTIPEEYNNSVVDLAVFFYKNRDKVGVTSSTQGARSLSLVDGIPESIKATLPLPALKLM